MRKKGKSKTATIVSGEERQRMPPPKETCEVVNKSGEEVLYQCGHSFAASWAHSLYGCVYEPMDEILTAREKCGECQLQDMMKLIIRCAACGWVILPNNPVALYAPDDALFKEEWTTLVGEDVIGCMRTRCCLFPAFFAGCWDGTKFVSHFGGNETMASLTIRTGQTICVSFED